MKKKEARQSSTGESLPKDINIARCAANFLYYYFVNRELIIKVKKFFEKYFPPRIYRGHSGWRTERFLWHFERLFITESAPRANSSLFSLPVLGRWFSAKADFSTRVEPWTVFRADKQEPTVKNRNSRRVKCPISMKRRTTDKLCNEYAVNFQSVSRKVRS